ncbi:ribonuclease H-like domain-containing protein, partial [Tanacetum coccineum]
MERDCQHGLYKAGGLVGWMMECCRGSMGAKQGAGWHIYAVSSLMDTMYRMSEQTQAIIKNGQVTVKNVRGRQSQGYVGNAGNNHASGARVINAAGNIGANQPRVVRCYNFNGEGYMAKQCTARKRVKDSEWFKKKMLLAQAQETRVVSDEEQQDFLADSLEEIDDCEDLPLQATTNFKEDHVDAYDSDCDEKATTNAIFMANLSPVGSLNDDTIAPRYDSDTLSEVPHYDTYHDYDKIKGNINVISYTDYTLTIGNDMMLSVIEQMKSQVEKCNKVNQEAKSVNESLTIELERYKDRFRVLEYAVKDGHSEKEAYLSRELYTSISQQLFLHKEEMDLETAQTTTTAKLPILKQGPVTTEEKAQKKNDDAKTLFVAIQIRFRGNEATKKTQKTLLKQMYENFSAPSTESLDSIFNKLQKIVSQLAILGINMIYDTMSIEILYNTNFNIVEQEVKGTASSSSSSQNMAFMSSPSSTNEVNIVYEVSTGNTQVSPASTQVSTASTQDLEQIHEDDIEEMDLKWKLALLSMRTRRFFQKTGRKITNNGSDTAGYDKSKLECFNCHKIGYFTRECRGPRNPDSRKRNQDSSRRTINVEETYSKEMVAIDGVGFDWSYMADNEVPTNMALMAFSNFEGHPQKEDQGYVDSGCSRHMTGNMSYLSDFKELDEEFFVGYSLNSKAFRVYNIRTSKVEENLHIRFSEDKPIITGDGPKWLFDIDVLTKSMNYVPVVAGTNSNDSVDGSLFDSSLKNASNDEPQPSSDARKKDDEGVCKESGIADQEKFKNSTQGVNTAGPSINTEPNMFSLRDNAIATHADFFGDETKVDMSNITTTYLIPSTLNTRIHKDHLLDHVIGDEEPKKVWILVDLPLGKRAISTKWVYKNKKDERGIMIRNKARLVAQGYAHEEGIDYDKVFALIARIEAI